MDPAVDAYIAALEPFRRERLTALRELVHAVVPEVTEQINWRMPVFGIGDRWVAVASQKSYVSVYLGSQSEAAAIVAADPKLKGGKACVNILDCAELPLAVLGAAIRRALEG